MLMAKQEALGETLPAYDYYFTVGQNIGTPRSTAPTAGRAWRTMLCPVAMDLFEVPSVAICPWALREAIILRHLDGLPDEVVDSRRIPS